MEDDEGVRYVLMLGIIGLNFMGPMSGSMKWITLIGAFALLIAISAIAINGLFSEIIPDKFVRSLAWFSILFTAVLLMIWWLSLPEFLNIDLP